VARRAADAAIKIQYPGESIEPRGASQFGGGETASCMELVEWNELSNRQPSFRAWP
jgi:hypothetical protein